MTWSRSTLAEIAESVDYGHTASADFGASGPKFLRITDIQDGQVNWDTVPRCKSLPRKQVSCKLERGDIVFARTGATTGKSFLLRDVPEDAVFASYLIRVRPCPSLVDPAYLARFFESNDYWAQVQQRSSGTAQGGVNATKLKSLSIPLPQLREQRRIAAILDKADALRAKRREAIAKCDQLLQSVFLDMFGDPVTNPKGWPVRPLGDLVRLDASLVDPREPQFCHLLHYGPDRIETDTGRLLPALTAEQDGLISKKFLCDQRHVLYSKIRPYLNKVAMVDRECLCSADVYPVEPIAEKILKRFLFQMLKSPAMLDHAAQFSNRANIPKINRNQLLSFRCISPPLELQRSFDSLASRVQALAAGVRGSTNKLDSLTAAINQRAFSRSPGKSL